MCGIGNFCIRESSETFKKGLKVDIGPVCDDDDHYESGPKTVETEKFIASLK